MDQHTLTTQQFGASAQAYLTSAVHAQGADLDRLQAVAERTRPQRVLDLGCGAGHASFALARGGAGRIRAYDPSAQMLDVVHDHARTHGYATIETCRGAAEVLPFADHSFELIVTRYSAHHWESVSRAVAECARVIRPGGQLIVIDMVAPELPLLDTALQVIEFLRDASHVRDYRVSEWAALLGAAGFAAPKVDTWRIGLEFQSWITRIRTSAPRVAALQAVFADLPAEVLEYFEVTPDHSFAADTAWLETRKTG